MNGHSFCYGGKQAFKMIASNALRVSAINSIGDFVLFLGKVLVVIGTVLVGLKLFQVRFQRGCKKLSNEDDFRIHLAFIICGFQSRYVDCLHIL